MELLRLVVGVVVLYRGAEWMVRGASGLARAFGIPPLIVGLTVVGYGSSAPEMTVSISAALRGSPAIAVGNAVGSNIANLGLILGMTALISPPRTDGSLIRREVPLLILSTLALPLLFLDGRLSRIEGALLICVAVAFTAWVVKKGLGAESTENAAKALQAIEVDAAAAAALGREKVESKRRLALLTVLGLALLIGGGELFVDGAVGLARRFGIGERVIGLTVVAIGTSLPELATSLVAASRGHSDLAVGNVIGSNLFNVLLVLGAAAAIRPFGVRLDEMYLDLAMLAAMTAFAVAMVRTERVLRRWEGAVLVLLYVAFLVVLVLRR